MVWPYSLALLIHLIFVLLFETNEAQACLELIL